MAYNPKQKIKALQKAVKVYIKESEKTGAHIPELEAVKKFFGKRGGISARATRSKKAQKEFEAAAKAVKQKFGSQVSTKRVKEAVAKRDQENKEREKKAAATYRKRKVKEAKGSEGKKNFRSVAQKAARQYKQLVGALSDAAMRELMETYGIKSDVIEYLAESGLTSEQIKEFIRQYAATVESIPEEARQLAADDQNFKAMQEIAAMQNDKVEFDNLADMFSAVINAADDGVDTEKVLDIVELYAEFKGSGNLSFNDFWEELQTQTDPYDLETARKVLEGDL